MSLRQSIFLISISILVNLAVSSLQAVPGYMDADYYYLGGRQLAMGEGFWEPVLWNYLDDPAGLPHPSHSYWMPLASMVVALGMKLTGTTTFASARLGFLAAVSIIPLITARLSYKIWNNRNWAFGSGLLAIFSGFYLPYATTTDTFTFYMLVGGIIFLLLTRLPSQSSLALVLTGVLIGILHLTRVDGILWLPVIVFFLVKSDGISRKLLGSLALFTLGYLIVMGPWFLRNYSIFGSLLSPGGNRTLWLTSYDQIFAYPANRLNFQNWWASGWSAILRARASSLWINLQRIVAEQGGIFLFPFIILGLWRSRSKLSTQVGALAWLLTIGVMTVIFPFAGARGGLFHACAAFQPLFWAVVPIGLSEFISWGVRKRRWQAQQAGKVFGVAGIGMMVVLSGVITYQRVIGPDPNHPQWEKTANHYQGIESRLQSLGADRESVVMVKNPPGYAVVNYKRAIVIPDGDFETLMAAATRYEVDYILLEDDHSQGLDPVYQDPKAGWPGVTYLGILDETILFKVH